MNRHTALLPLALFIAGALSPVQAATPSLDIETVNQADATTDAKARASMLRLQVMLERARFSPGQIDGRDGGNTRTALAGYRESQGLGSGDSLDAKTWAALTSTGAPALVEYTVTEADVSGPFTDIPSGMMAQAKLERLGYESAKEALGEKFHANPELLSQLNPGKDITQPGATIVVPNVLDLPALPKATRVVVDDSDKTVSLFDAADKKIAQFPATTGSSHDPLPIGEWKINGVAKEPVFHYNPKLFWDSDPSHSKAKIAPGPNNPVGVVWIDLSKEHYGLHGTPAPALIGKTQSHGCIRLTNWSAMAVAQAVSPGTPAILQN
ncbi:L,D-transpeptidase family protein [Lysobacter korlensis]|uniref:L,D-transpeptidase family protein n=1 Tax=Lysobacter korlensis TaxID=553636 RepID=A0ABV6RL29_9GAMM